MMFVPQAIMPDLTSPPAFSGYTDQFYGGPSVVAGKVAVPHGAGSVVMRLESGGGGGSRVGGVGANGGGGGAYAESTITLDHSGGGSDDGGKEISFSLGVAGQGRVGTSGSGTDGADCTITGSVTAGAISITCTGGKGATNLLPGVGGTATGGGANYDGQPGGGENGGPSGSGVFGGEQGQPGAIGGGGGGPGDIDGFYQLDGGNGGASRCSFEWHAP